VKENPSGQFQTISTVGGERCKAFIPDPLPPDLSLETDPELRSLSEDALLALGRLDSVSSILPDASLFLWMYVRKEAVLSSQIEGTQSSLSDLLRFESKAAPGVPLDDVREVSNYVAAMDYGLERIRGGFPLSLRLLKEIHGVLLRQGRGAERKPGEFRTSQNWIGGSRPGNAIYVPPPPDQLADAMGKLEKFLHDDPVRVPLLFKAALAHVQFETIHPFLDGNGRLGRLLIALLLCTEGALSQPTLYLSLFLKSHRSDYYELLQRVRTHGDWKPWISFFLRGVKETAAQAVATAKQVADLFKTDRGKIEALGRSGSSDLRLHHILQEHPVLTTTRAAELASVSFPTAASSLARLGSLDIVHALETKGRARVFAYSEYIGILNEGTTPL